ncbi:MAG: M56 family metallopeptidase [Ruminococcaceae bacterium]|nr:M56 family metallopeptidase [Oscillospiraceae bacterium]
MDRFVISLGVCSLMMTAVSFVYLLLSKTLKNVQSSKWRYYSWILILIGFITPYKPDFGSSAVNIDVSQTNETALYGNIGDRYFMINRSEILLYIVFIVWLTGVIAVLGAAFLKQRSFIRSVKRLAVPVPYGVKKAAERLAINMCVTADVKVITVKEIASPMVVGMFKPLLILPDRSFTVKELHLILKHELVHIKRHDLLIKAFMVLCEAVHWFNPFVRFFIRAAEQECELYCDETVMKNESAEFKKMYCRSILNTVSAERKINGRLIPALSSNFYFNKHGLKHRIKMILSFNKKYKLGFLCGLTAALTLVTGTAFAFSSEPPSDDNILFDTTTFVTAPELSVTTSYDDTPMIATSAHAAAEVSPAYSTVTENADVITGYEADGDIY